MELSNMKADVSIESKYEGVLARVSNSIDIADRGRNKKMGQINRLANN